MVASGGAGLAVGVGAGLALGARVRERSSKTYWLLNAADMVLGVAIMIVGGLLGWMWLGYFGVGLTAGGLTGLKYGYGRSVGLWRVHDRALGTDEELRD